MYCAWTEKKFSIFNNVKRSPSTLSEKYHLRIYRTLSAISVADTDPAVGSFFLMLLYFGITQNIASISSLFCKTETLDLKGLLKVVSDEMNWGVESILNRKVVVWDRGAGHSLFS